MWTPAGQSENPQSSNA